MPQALRTSMLMGLAVLLIGCGVKRLDRQWVEPSRAGTLDQKSPYLKAHLRNGRVYVLNGWSFDSAERTVVGRGDLLDWNRVAVETGSFHLPLDSVALFETNVATRSGSMTALTVMAGITAAVAGICLTNPKSCFGSCPTFYAPGPNGSILQAEGFSASIAPALEATDVDALYRAVPTGRDFVVRMTNEAFETHVARSVNLLVAPRPPGGRVFTTAAGAFWQTAAPAEPVSCRDIEGDCLDRVRTFDGNERFVATDSTDLGAKEDVDLTFAAPSGAPVGLVVTARQTLLSTFLLYQGLSYLGGAAAPFLVALANRHDSTLAQSGVMGKTLGGIDVLTLDSAGVWVQAGTIGETGPLAADTKLVPIPNRAGGPLRIRLRMTRGLWRIDYVALARLAGTVAPIRLPPVRVVRDGGDDPAALAALLDSTRVLTSLPGDAYELHYRLPADPAGQELFLEARGYYLEWMRREWLAEEDSRQAARMLLDPAGMLRTLAPRYKRLEPSMEALFWNSRYVRH